MKILLSRSQVQSQRTSVEQHRTDCVEQLFHVFRFRITRPTRPTSQTLQQSVQVIRRILYQFIKQQDRFVFAAAVSRAPDQQYQRSWIHETSAQFFNQHGSSARHEHGPENIQLVDWTFSLTYGTSAPEKLIRKPSQKAMTPSDRSCGSKVTSCRV